MKKMNFQITFFEEKSKVEISLYECLEKSTTVINPFRDPGRLVDRRSFVIRRWQWFNHLKLLKKINKIKDSMARGYMFQRFEKDKLIQYIKSESDKVHEISDDIL